MKTVNETVDESFYNAYEGAQLKPYVLIEYLDDSSEWQILADVTGMSFNSRANDNRKTVYTLMPPSSTLSLALDNKGEQYTTGAGGTYDGVLALNRKIRARVTYILGE